MTSSPPYVGLYKPVQQLATHTEINATSFDILCMFIWVNIVGILYVRDMHFYWLQTVNTILPHDIDQGNVNGCQKDRTEG